MTAPSTRSEAYYTRSGRSPAAAAAFDERMRADRKRAAELRAEKLRAVKPGDRVKVRARFHAIVINVDHHDDQSASTVVVRQVRAGRRHDEPATVRLIDVTPLDRMWQMEAVLDRLDCAVDLLDESKRMLADVDPSLRPLLSKLHGAVSQAVGAVDALRWEVGE